MRSARQKRRLANRQGSPRKARRSRVRGSLLGAASIGLLAVSAQAVVIAGPDGAANTTAPSSQDPGFSNVGVINGLSGVYVRNGWVLSANHVGLGSIDLGGVVYDAVPGSLVRFSNPTGPDADLMAFKLRRMPPLPDLQIASAPPSSGEDVILIGNGRNRGDPLAEPWNGYDGWTLAGGRTVRWGTNRILATGLDVLETEAFSTRFDDLPGQMGNDPEAQVANGDSGGGAFVWNGGNPELIGILFAQGLYNGQSSSDVLFGNISYVSDLDFYRAQIEPLIDQPGCSDGLDDDGDGLTDYPEDPGCASASDPSESTAALPCDNGIDDDLDGFIDWPADYGCADLLSPTEAPEPGFGLSLGAGILGLAAAARRRRI